MKGLRVAIGVLCLAVGACGRQHMADQPRLDTFTDNTVFSGGQTARTPPAGTVPFGAAASTTRPAWSKSLILRGRDRFNIYCAPCHGFTGQGDGFIVRRGFPAPPSYHEARLRTADDEHFYNVISEGYGIMFDYAEALEPADRWAVVAWIRTLQFARNAPEAELPSRYRQVPAEAAP